MAAAEKRAVAQLADAREEAKRQAALAESVSRIEAGLFARAEEERSSAARERDLNLKALEDARKEAADSALVSNQKIMALEEQIESLRKRYEEALNDSSELKQEVGRLSGLSQASQERAALLERQLNFAQERLSSITGATSLNAIRAEDAATKEVQLERALLEVESLKSQLASAEQHADQFRKIGASTEAMLKDLQARAASSRADLEAKVASLQAEVEAARAESSERLAVALKSEEEISNIQTQMRELEKQHAAALTRSAEEIRQAQALADQAVAQMNILKLDTESFQQAARAAQSNYDRELQLHASAAARARDSEAALESLRVQLAVANQKISEITSDAIRREKLSEENMKAVRGDLDALREEKESLQKINDRLHSEIQALGVQVDRLQNSRAAAALGESAVSEGAGGSAAPAEGESELTSLRSSLSELREVIRYMKRERDLLEARVAVADTENARHVGTIAALQRSLDETRSELKKELDTKSKGSGSRSEEEFLRLMAEVTQINIVRESNAHMRRENEELSKKVTSLSTELASAKNSIAPLNEQLRKLEASVASLSAERDSLANDAKYWKERMHTLVSRYNDVDPEAHRLLANKLEEAEAQSKVLKSDVERLSAQNTKDLATIEKLRADLEAANKELESSKSAIESSGKNAELLRTRLRDFNKLNREMKLQVESLTSELEAAKATTAATSATQAASASAPPVPPPAAPPVASAAPAAPTAPIPAPPPPPARSQLPVTAPSAPVAAIAPPLPPSRPLKRPLEETPAEVAPEPAPAATTAPAKASAEDSLREQLLMRRQQKAAKAAESVKATEAGGSPPASASVVPPAAPPVPPAKTLKKPRVVSAATTLAAPAESLQPPAVAAEEPTSSVATPVEDTAMEVEKSSDEASPVEKAVSEVVAASTETPVAVPAAPPAAQIAPTLKVARGRPVPPSASAPAAASPAVTASETPAAAPPAPKLTFGAFAAGKTQPEPAVSAEQPNEPAKTSFASFGQSKLNPFAAAFQGW
jgi:nucleoprotein TPR